MSRPDQCFIVSIGKNMGHGKGISPVVNRLLQGHWRVHVPFMPGPVAADAASRAVLRVHQLLE